MTRALAFGHSQIGALMRGHRSLRSRGEIGYDLNCLGFWEEQYKPLQHSDGGRMRYNPRVLQDISDAIGQLAPDCLIVSILGAEPYLYGIINDPRPFDFLLPDQPEFGLSPGTELIPYDLLARRFRGDLDWQFDIVRSVQELHRLPMYHIEAPPPVANADLIAAKVYGHFKEKMIEFGRPGVSFRYKVWWLFSQMAKDICAELGIIPIDGPPESRDVGGFLAETYFLDGVHGTDEYGALIAREVARAMQSSGLSGG